MLADCGGEARGPDAIYLITTYGVAGPAGLITVVQNTNGGQTRRRPSNLVYTMGT